MQLEDYQKTLNTRRLFEQILNHSNDLAHEHIREIRLPKIETGHKTIWHGHVDGSFTFYFNNKMYVFDCHPASSLYEITQLVNAEFTLFNTDIRATKLLKG